MSAQLTIQQTIALLKHLNAGRTVDEVAKILHITPSQAGEIARSHGHPDPGKVAWAIDVLTKKAASAEQAAIPARTERPRPTPAPVAAVPSTSNTAVVVTHPDEIRVLLNTAKGHPSKRIQNAADKVFDALDRVKALISEDEAKNSKRRKADQARAKARAEVERLEAELAAAKTKLRGKPAPAATSSRSRGPVERDGQEYPCRHDGCDRVFDTPQGRAMHERLRCDLNPLRQQPEAS